MEERLLKVDKLISHTYSLAQAVPLCGDPIRPDSGSLEAAESNGVEIRRQNSVAPGQAWSVGIGGERATFEIR